MNKSIDQNQKILNRWTLMTGLLLGAAAVLLLRLGNPPNMGICAACFIRDASGGLCLFSSPGALQYLRPEVPGFLLGSFVAAFAFREFKARGGTSPALRFILGAFVMIGALVFLGCPIRLIERLSGGDYVSGLAGLGGMVCGAGGASLMLRRGFSFGAVRNQSRLAGFVAPALGLGLVAFTLYLALGNTGDPNGLLETKRGAPMLAAFGIAFVVGAFAQRSRFCTVGGFRDAFLGSGFRLLSGYVVFFSVMITGNLLVDLLWPGAVRQFEMGASPAAHSVHLWNFLGMFLVGLASILLGGCPFRQLVAAGQGSSDGTMAVLGMMFGAAFCHNFGLAAAPAAEGLAGGPAAAGMAAVVLGIVVCVITGFSSRSNG